MLPLFFVMIMYNNETKNIITHSRNMITVIPPANIDISDDATDVVVIVIVGNTALDVEKMDEVVIEG